MTCLVSRRLLGEHSRFALECYSVKGVLCYYLFDAELGEKAVLCWKGFSEQAAEDYIRAQAERAGPETSQPGW